MTFGTTKKNKKSAENGFGVVLSDSRDGLRSKAVRDVTLVEPDTLVGTDKHGNDIGGPTRRSETREGERGAVDKTCVVGVTETILYLT